MDVDVVDEQLSTSAQPVPRARRTYGSKAKAPIVSSDDHGSEAHSSLLSRPFWTEPTALSSIATSTTTYQASDWRQDLAKIDQDMPLSDDENESQVAAATSNATKSRVPESLSSPSSPDSHIRRLPNASRTPMRNGNSMAGQTNQYSANTSLASGTSGAVSSPSTDTLSQSHPTNSLRPGPPPHAESFQDEDIQASSQSEPPSPRQVLRETTPDEPRPSGARLLAPSPFASPVKSFSRATAIKQRIPPKFLGSNDADDHEMQGIREEDENASSSDDSATGRKTKKKPTDAGHVKNKVKKPSKKDVIEGDKEMARIRAKRDLDVQEKAEYAPLTFGNFFQKKLQLTAKVPAPPLPFSPFAKEDAAANDPIRSFSSSSPHHGIAGESDEEQLDPERVIASNRREATAVEAKRNLQQRKLQALKARAVINEDDDSDLEIVVPTVAKDPLSRLAAATAGKKGTQTFPTERKKTKTSGAHREMTREEHNRTLKSRVGEQSTNLMANKKADYVIRGGQLTKQDKAAAAKHTDVRELLAKAALTSGTHHPEDQEHDDEADDESYEPPEEDQETLQGSSPKHQKPNVLVQDSSVYLEQSEDEMEEDALEEHIPSAQARRRASSDIEGESPIVAHAPVRRRPQLIISDEEEEDDDDVVIGSDNENQPPNSAVSRSTVDSSGAYMFPKFTQRTLASSSPRTPLGELPTMDGKRSGLSFQKSFSFTPGQPLSPSQQRMTINLDVSRESSPSKGALLLPAFGEASFEKGSNKSSSPFGFSAIFGDEDEDKAVSVSRSGKLMGGFKPADFGAISTQLFQTQSSPSQRASPSKRSRPSLENKDGFAKLRVDPQDDDFLLSQVGPLGRIAMSTQEVKAIKDAEQLDAAEVLKDTEEERLKRLKEVEEDNEPRWLNDAGLFTQTKPADLPWSLTQNLLSQTSFSQSSGQSSLFPQSGELNAEQLLSQRSPAKSPLRRKRLKRKGELEESEYALGEALPASPVTVPTAFDALMKPKIKTKAPVIAHNDFVHGEAEESDDELQLGFSKRRTEEDEEAAIDPEEEAKLVDDTKLSEAQLREDAVVEKHMEHLAEDDAANQRIQEMAIKGQLRKNKRGHGMMEDDSSDDERTARGAKFKKRRVVGIDHLDDLAVNPDTVAFHKSYIKDLPGVDGTEEDHNEFAHLNKVNEEAVTDGDAESDHASDSEMLSGSEGDARRVPKFDLQQRIREMTSRGEDLLGEDLQDPDEFVNNFMPSSDGMLPVEYDNYSTVPHMGRRVTKIQREGSEILPPRGIAGSLAGMGRQRLEQWAKQNERGRDVSARGTASAAVTGHSKTTSGPKKAALDRSKSMVAPRPLARADTGSTLGSKLGKTKSMAWEE